MEEHLHDEGTYTLSSHLLWEKKEKNGKNPAQGEKRKLKKLNCYSLQIGGRESYTTPRKNPPNAHKKKRQETLA